MTRSKAKAEETETETETPAPPEAPAPKPAAQKGPKKPAAQKGPKTPEDHLLGLDSVIVYPGVRSLVIHDDLDRFLWYTDKVEVTDATLENFGRTGSTLEGRITQIEQARVRGKLKVVGALSKSPLLGDTNAAPPFVVTSGNPPEIVFPASSVVETGGFKASIK